MTDRSTDERSLSPALTRRLPAYFRTLIRFYGTGKERISSEELASEMGLAPSQVRADMKAIGCTGQRSYGYGIPSLYKAIGGILQLCDRFSAVIVGSSPLAKAIEGDSIFTKRGLKLSMTVEDGDKEKLVSVLSENTPDIVLLCGDAGFAKQALGLISESENAKSVLQVWNFTECELSNEKINVKNVHFSDILMELCFEVGK